MTPLQRAQAFVRHTEGIHAKIVDALRRQGWSREDAIEEADAKISWMLEREDREEADGEP